MDRDLKAVDRGPFDEQRARWLWEQRRRRLLRLDGERARAAKRRWHRDKGELVALLAEVGPCSGVVLADAWKARRGQGLRRQRFYDLLAEAVDDGSVVREGRRVRAVDH